MKLRELKIENYRCYASATLEFPTGPVGVIGPNGAGKSTILEAVTWALFGESRTAKEEIRADFAPPEAPCRVEVGFELAGENFRAVRELRGKALIPRARLTKEGIDEPLAEGADAVSECAQRLLGMDKRTFFASVFSKQKQVDALTEIPKGRREQAFRRMLGLDALDRVAELLRADARAIEDELKGLAQRRKDSAKLAAEEKSFKAGSDEQKEKLEAAREAVQEAKASESAARKEVDGLHDLERAHGKLDKERAQWQTKADNLAGTLKKLDGDLADCRAAKATLAEQRPKLDALSKARERIRKLDPLRTKYLAREKDRERKDKMEVALKADRETLAGLKDRVEELAQARKEQARLELERDAAKPGAEKAREASSDAQAKLAAVQRELDKLDERVESLRKLGKGGKCPTCLQKLGESFEDALTHFADERRAVHDKVKVAKEAATSAKEIATEKVGVVFALEKEHNKVQSRVHHLAPVEGRWTELESSIRRQEVDIKRLARGIEALADLDFNPKEYDALKEREEELAPLEKQAGRLEEKAARIPGIEKEIRDTRGDQDKAAGELKRLAKETAALGFDPAALKKAEKAHQAARNARETREEARNEIDRALVGLRKDLERVQKEIEEERELGRLAAEKERNVSDLKLLEQVFKDFRQHLTDRIRPTLAAKAGALLGRTTGGRYSQVELNDDYDVRVYDGGQPHPLDRYSGGESDLINLCLRIAIAQIVSDRGEGRVNLLVLDEVFGSQDPLRKDALLRGLKELSRDFQQVFVITHDEFVKDRMESVIEVERPEGGRSQARLL